MYSNIRNPYLKNNNKTQRSPLQQYEFNNSNSNVISNINVPGRQSIGFKNINVGLSNASLLYPNCLPLNVDKNGNMNCNYNQYSVAGGTNPFNCSSASCHTSGESHFCFDATANF